MFYEATIDSDTLAMMDTQTLQVLDAVAVIPSHAPDLAALISMLTPQMAEQVARWARVRAWGP